MKLPKKKRKFRGVFCKTAKGGRQKKSFPANSEGNFINSSNTPLFFRPFHVYNGDGLIGGLSPIDNRWKK